MVKWNGNLLDMLLVSEGDFCSPVVGSLEPLLVLYLVDQFCDLLRTFIFTPFGQLTSLRHVSPFSCSLGLP